MWLLGIPGLLRFLHCLGKYSANNLVLCIILLMRNRNYTLTLWNAYILCMSYSNVQMVQMLCIMLSSPGLFCIQNVTLPPWPQSLKQFWRCYLMFLCILNLISSMKRYMGTKLGPPFHFYKYVYHSNDIKGLNIISLDFFFYVSVSLVGNSSI